MTTLRRRRSTSRPAVPAPTIIEARDRYPLSYGKVAGQGYADRLFVPRERMQRARKARGMTQYDLAKATGLTITSIANLECGRTRYPRLVTMDAIATALGVELKWLQDD